MLGAVSQFEKASLVAKLKGARDCKRRETGKFEGRKTHVEKRPGTVALAKKLHRVSPKIGKRMSLRKISATLKESGHLNENGRPFNQRSIKAMAER